MGVIIRAKQNNTTERVKQKSKQVKNNKVNEDIKIKHIL